MTGAVLPPPPGPNLNVWAQQVSAFIGRTAGKLRWKNSGDSPSENGMIAWDEVNGYPVVSKGGVWRRVLLEDGNYAGGISSNVTAAAADTAYALTFTSSVSDGIANDGTYPSRIVFAEAGEYLINFSAQIASSTASAVTFRFWPRVNGTNVAGSTMVNSLHNNGSTFVTSRSALFQLAAGDYLEAMWATTDTNGYLSATAATAYAPAAPAATIGITRAHG